MNNWKKILESDLLERYVLGAVSMSEQEQVEQLRNQHDEIDSAVENLEKMVELMSLQNAIPSPPDLKAKILDQIHQEEIAHPTSNSSSVLRKSLLAIAGVAIGLIGASLFFTPQVNTLKESLKESKEQLELCNEESVIYAFLNSPTTTPIGLQGTAIAPSSRAVVYWNSIEEKAYVRVANMPAIRDDQTLQIWADVHGEMIDLGIFDVAEASKNPVAIDFLKEAESLNITIEPKGGSEHPTVSTLSTISTGPLS